MLGYQEIIIILVIALLVFGPAKLPEIGRQVGGALRELRKMSSDMQRALDLDDSHSSHSSSSRYEYNGYNNDSAAIAPYEYKAADAATTYSQDAPPSTDPAAAETYDEAHHRFLYDPLAEGEDGRDALHAAADGAGSTHEPLFPDSPTAAVASADVHTTDDGARAAAATTAPPAATAAVEHKES